MDTNALNNNPLYTHISLDVVGRVTCNTEYYHEGYDAKGWLHGLMSQ